MNVVVCPKVSLADFLAREKQQPQRYEFDGTQPIPMTGGTVAHARLVRRIMQALSRLLAPEYEPFGGALKVHTAPGRVRYPDVLVLRGCETRIIRRLVFSPSPAVRRPATVGCRVSKNMIRPSAVWMPIDGRRHSRYRALPVHAVR
jgi:hypothetical protein